MMAMTLKTFAADLLVEEFAVAPAFGSIGSAVAAATDGDRIIIKNRNGNMPWIENVAVNKSLQFLPYSNDTFFVVQGTYTITPADNREISIIGMRNVTGNITATVVANPAARTKVNIMGSYLQAGSVTFNQNGYLLNIVHTLLAGGNIAIRSGNVIGCDIHTSTNAASITIAAETAVTTSVNRIVGNKIANVAVNAAAVGISWASTTHLFEISNNLVLTRNIGIAIARTKLADVTANKLRNNTVSINGATTTSNVFGINITTASAGSVVEIMNNLIDLNSTSTANIVGINNTSAVPAVSMIYNAVDRDIAQGKQFTGNFTTNSNNVATAVAIAADGRIVGTGGVNAGNPAAAYYDLDLTVNDCGAYGGGFTLDNYFPIHAGAARVYMVNVPANVRVGNTLNIQADGYDR